MCGRFTLTANVARAAQIFGVETEEQAPPRYNIAPTQPIHVIAQEFGRRRLQLMRWGFVPAWVKEPETFTLIINARCETVTTKPSFRSAIRHRRCIIPATGFYEWHRDGKMKTPYFIKPKDAEIVGYAGIFETYAAANGSEIDTVCFMTTEADGEIANIHHRMPVLVSPNEADRWLDCVQYGPHDVEFLYQAKSAGKYDIIPVSDRINIAKNDDSALQDRVEAEDAASGETRESDDRSTDQLTLF